MASKTTSFILDRSTSDWAAVGEKTFRRTGWQSKKLLDHLICVWFGSVVVQTGNEESLMSS